MVYVPTQSRQILRSGTGKLAPCQPGLPQHLLLEQLSAFEMTGPGQSHALRSSEEALMKGPSRSLVVLEVVSHENGHAG